VGVAQDDRIGYDIPIETVLAEFNQKREIASSLQTSISQISVPQLRPPFNKCITSGINT